MTPLREASGGEWTLDLDPPVLLPSRPVRARIRYRPAADHQARGVRAVLRAEETFQYRRNQSSGKTSRVVTHTAHDEVARLEATLAGPTAFRAGQEVGWEVAFDVPPLAPATFEGSDVLRCEWTLEVSCDVPWRGDDRMVAAVRVAQPMALLRAGVVASGQYGLFEDAPVNVDAYPAQVRLEPVPLSVAHPFSGELRVETAEPIEVQEVRLELRVHARCTERRGLEDELLVASGRLDTPTGTFGGPFAVHPFSGDAPGVWTPTVDLRHGQARARFHVILALSWRPDIHYVRDVALASTTEL